LNGCFVHAQSPIDASSTAEEIPWNQRSGYDRAFNSTYEDHYTFKHREVYVADPFVWGYSKEFAERFKMPKQWIEPGLKGALAVAWRMTKHW